MKKEKVCGMHVSVPVFLWIFSSCLTRVSGESFPTQSPTLSRSDIVRNLTSSYSAFLDDIYSYLGSAVNVSEECRSQMNQVQRLADFGEINALKMFDSSGKPESGILEGGVYFIGFYSECIGAEIHTQDISIGGKYCLLNLNASGIRQQILPDPSRHALQVAEKPPSIGLCVPLACSNVDVQFATDASLQENFQDIKGNVAVCHTDINGFSDDVPAIIFFCFQLLVIFVVLLATFYEYFVQWKKNKDATAMSVSTELLCDPSHSIEDKGRLKYLLCFSMNSNASKIFTVAARDNIGCLHGLRFLSMALIIFGHSYSFAGTILFLRNPGFASQAPKDFMTQIFANGTFAVDTFFFMSGLLVCYAGIKTLENAKNKWFWLLVFYVHRYIRLTPLVLAVILNCALLLRYTGSGPNWLASIQMYDAWCKKQWWVNVLYIHNFYGTENMCLSHTWYLATDLQMYLVAPLIMIPLVWNWKAGLTSMGVFLLATTVATAVLTAQNHYPAIPYINHVVPLDVVNAYYKNVYIKPYCRMGPFIVGMALGYLLYKKKEFILNKFIVALCWLVSLAAGLLVIYLMWPANQGILPTNAEAAAYSALARTVWGICLAWLTFACYYGYAGFVNTLLSWSAWVPLSRLTFPAYLIHPVIMSAIYGSTEGSREFSYGYMMYMFIGHICITYFISLFLSLMYESPFVCLEKIVLSPKKKPQQESAHKKSLDDIVTRH